MARSARDAANLSRGSSSEALGLLDAPSVMELVRSRTFLISLGVIIGAWALGLGMIPLQGPLYEVHSATVWTVAVLVYLGVTVFISFPLVTYAAFMRAERRYALADTSAELRHYGWDSLVDSVAGRYEEAFRPERYAIPLLMATTTAVLGWVLVVFSDGFAVMARLAIDGTISSALAQVRRAHPVAFGFLGAYFFSLQYLFRRYLARDLSPRVYMHVVVRTWIVMILTFVYATIRNPSAQDWSAEVIAVSFVGGVTPNIVWQALHGRASLLLGKLGDGETEDMPLGKIQGLNTWQRARLVEAGVENVQNLAMADVVELMVTTRLGAVRLLDWIDQSLFYVHVGDDIEAYRKEGIRTASSFALSLDGSDDSPGADSKKLGLALAITNHPNFHRIRQLRDMAKRNVGYSS